MITYGFDKGEYCGKKTWTSLIYRSTAITTILKSLRRRKVILATQVALITRDTVVETSLGTLKTKLLIEL